MDSITAYFDGLCAPCNPGGVATWGIVILGNKKIIHKDCGLACEPYSPTSTNNYAEYTALIKALEFCLKNDFPQVGIFGDSQLVIRQMLGEYNVNSPNIQPLHQKATAIARKIENVSFTWVKREQNVLADEMSNIAYQQHKQHKGANSAIVMPFGKYKGQPISTVAKKDSQYLAWLSKQDLRPELKERIQQILP